MSHAPHQTVVVQESPGTSGLAIAGLIFAIFGWFTCGLLCIPGAFLCFLALFSRGPKGAAIAGLIVGFPGTLFFAFVGLGMVMSVLGVSAGAVSEARRAAQEIQAKNDAADYVPFPQPIEIGGLRCIPLKACIAETITEILIGGDRKKQGEMLRIELLLENTTETKRISYSGWPPSHRRVDLGVEDDHGNTYSIHSYGSLERIVGDGVGTIEPGESMNAVVVCEPPINAATKLFVSLDGDSVGLRGEYFRWTIAKEQWTSTDADREADSGTPFMLPERTTISPPPARRASPPPRTKLTMANFERINTGVSSKSVVIGILGNDYTLVSENEFGQGTQFHVKTELLQWQDGLRTIHVTFQNGKVAQKSQFGLPRDDPVAATATEPAAVSEPDADPRDRNLRVWTDSNGEELAEAKYVKSDSDSVTLETADGEEMTVAFDDLSQASRNWVYSIKSSIADTLPASQRPSTKELFDLSMKQKLEEEGRVEEEQRRLADEAQYRTWTTADGKFSVEAKFVKFVTGTLTLEKRDGSEVSVKLDILSEDDKDFVRERGRK